GRLPLQFLLKNELHFNAQTLAAFLLIVSFPWNVKPLAGILSDAFPLLGTRRRHYMLLAAGLAAVCWFLLGVVPRAHTPLLLAALGASIFGPITSVRQLLQSAVSLGNGLLGGYLAGVAFGWTVGIATGMLVVLAVTTFFTLLEPPIAARDGPG